MCVAAAVAGGAVASGVIGAAGAQSAANTQADAQKNAAAQQMSMFNTINGQEQPFIQAGQNATGSLSQLLGLTPGGGTNEGILTRAFDPSSITSSPGYQFAQQQGLQAVTNAEAPLVGALSGPALKALTNFSTGTAAQYYNDYFNQFQTQQNNIFNRLSGLAGLGQNAASQVGNNGAQLGTGAAQATAAAGGAQAGGTVGAANALSGGIGSASNILALNSMLSQNNSGFNPTYQAAYSGFDNPANYG